MFDDEPADGPESPEKGGEGPRNRAVLPDESSASASPELQVESPAALAFHRRARLAEDRLAEVLAAYRQLKTENEDYRDRTTRNIERRYEQRRERLLLKFMEILDNLDRALDAAEHAGNPLIQGLILVRIQLLQTLQDEGLERIPALGLAFDPAVAESVGSQPVEDPDHHHVVVKELLRGYRLNGRIARPARVVIGMYVAAAEAEVEDDALIGADEVAPPLLIAEPSAEEVIRPLLTAEAGVEDDALIALEDVAPPLVTAESNAEEVIPPFLSAEAGVEDDALIGVEDVAPALLIAEPSAEEVLPPLLSAEAGVEDDGLIGVEDVAPMLLTVAHSAEEVIPPLLSAEAGVDDDGLIGMEEMAPPLLTVEPMVEPVGAPVILPAGSLGEPLGDPPGPFPWLEPTFEPIPDDEGRSLEEIIAAAERQEAETRIRERRPAEDVLVPAAPLDDERAVAEPATAAALIPETFNVTLLPEHSDD